MQAKSPIWGDYFNATHLFTLARWASNGALTGHSLLGRLKVSASKEKGVYKMFCETQVWNGVRTNLYLCCKNSTGAHLPLMAGWTRSVPDSLLATPVNNLTSQKLTAWPGSGSPSTREINTRLTCLPQLKHSNRQVSRSSGSYWLITLGGFLPPGATALCKSLRTLGNQLHSAKVCFPTSIDT
jgi:hypothetical protein